MGAGYMGCNEYEATADARKSLKVSAVLEKLAIHYYVPAQTKECCRGYTSQLTDLQPKNLLVNLLNSAARSEQERGFKVQLQRPSCTCTVYILYLLFLYNNNLQFYKNKLLLLLLFTGHSLRGNYQV